MPRHEGLSRLPRLSRTILSFPEKPCPRKGLSNITLRGLFALIALLFLAGRSTVGASQANLLQTMHQPGEQPALFPLFPLFPFFRTFRAERERLERSERML
jgi:hypothetical protein